MLTFCTKTGLLFLNSRGSALVPRQRLLIANAIKPVCRLLLQAFSCYLKQQHSNAKSSQLLHDSLYSMQEAKLDHVEMSMCKNYAKFAAFS